MPWDIIPQFPLLLKVLIEIITINKDFIPHKHPKEFIFDIRLEKVKLLPLVKELICIIINPGKKGNVEIIIYYSLNIVILKIFIKSIIVELTSKSIAIKKIFNLIS